MVNEVGWKEVDSMGNCVTELTSDRLVRFTHCFLCSISCVDSGKKVASSSSGGIPNGMDGGLDPLLLVQNRNWEVPNSICLKVFPVNLCLLQSVKLEILPRKLKVFSKQKILDVAFKKRIVNLICICTHFHAISVSPICKCGHF